MRSEAPYWIKIRPDHFSSRHPADQYGPFTPGETVHEIRIDDASQYARPEPWTGDIYTPESGEGSVRAQVRDSRDGSEVRATWHDLREATGTLPGFKYTMAAFHGSINNEWVLPVGEWSGILKASGYRDGDQIRFSVREGEVTDAGTIDLIRNPRFRARVFSPEGDHLAIGTSVRARPAPNTSSFYRAWVRDDGTIELSHPPACPFVLSIPFRGNQLTHGVQTFLISSYIEGEVLSLHLRPWQPVELSIEGLDPPHAQNETYLQVLYPRQQGPWGNSATEPEVLIRRAQEFSPSPDGARRFRCHLAPGRYKIDLQSLLYELPTSSIEVRVASGPQIFTLSARRRE